MNILHFGQPFMPFVLAAALIGIGTPALAQTAPKSGAQDSMPVLDERFDDAMQAYERNQWSQAFDAFLKLAEEGHVDAARLVMQMHWHGTRLYGQQFALTALQMERFSRCPPLSQSIGLTRPARPSQVPVASTGSPAAP